MKKVSNLIGWAIICSFIITLGATIYSSSAPVDQKPLIKQQSVSEEEEFEGVATISDHEFLSAGQ